MFVFTCSLDLCRKSDSEDDAEEVLIGSLSTKGYVATNDVNAPVFVGILSYAFITTCIDMFS